MAIAKKDNLNVNLFVVVILLIMDVAVYLSPAVEKNKMFCY